MVQLLLEKRQEEECKQRVEHREGTVLSSLHRCNLVQIPPAGGWLLWGSGCWGPLTPRQKQ